jgi:hypothetical protein
MFIAWLPDKKRRPHGLAEGFHCFLAFKRYQESYNFLEDLCSFWNIESIRLILNTLACRVNPRARSAWREMAADRSALSYWDDIGGAINMARYAACRIIE